MKRYVVALDLEMNQPSDQIIQIGACVGDLLTGAVVDRFESFVNPGEPILDRITTLTGISDADVAKAPSAQQAYQSLVAWLDAYKEKRYLSPVTWGGGDTDWLKQQAACTDDIPWVFGRRWLDVKTLFIAWRMSEGEMPRSGLGRSMLKVGLEFEGVAHHAADDAVNTFRMYMALLKKFKE